MKLATLSVILLSLISFVRCSNDHNETATGTGEKPNFIIIYADDLGYGDLACFGAPQIRTPNIDKMAEGGMKMTSFYSASPVCSPSRAALLTGRYPVRMGIYGVFFPDSYYGMSPDEVTIAEVLAKAGYATGLIGKWHLGSRFEYLPLQQGFDEYFGIPYSNDMSSVMYMRGNTIEEPSVDQHLITRTYTEEAVDFIQRHKEEPFLLYLAHNMPHVPIYASEDFREVSEAGLYGDVIEEIDWSTGEIMKTIKNLGIERNTLIIFSSDNGPWLVMRELGGSAGPLREGKQYTFEGGMRVPTLVYWPGTVPPGREYNDIALMLDWMPTLTALAGVDLPDSLVIDGENITDILMGKTRNRKRAFGFYNGAELRAFRYGDWKIKYPFKGTEGAAWQKPVSPHGWLLYNLKEDPGETLNLVEAKQEKFQELKVRMESFQEYIGPLPPSVMLRGAPGDNSHYQYLIETYGENYWMMD